MGLRDIFSGKNPEIYEQKGDTSFHAKAYGKAIVEYERALERLEKTSPWDDGYRQSLQEKIRNSKDVLALEHCQTATDLVEAGHHKDAGQYFELALELTADPKLKKAIHDQLQKIEAQLAEAVQIDSQDDVIAEQEKAPDEKPIHEEQNDEYFMALIGTLPEEVQDAYLSYPQAFKKGYLALNQGEFEAAARHLARAMEEHPDPRSYIPLELATARLNLEKYDDARRLLESFLQYHPDALPAYQFLCEIFWETKTFNQAETLLSSLPPELSESVAGYLLRGETYYHAGKYAQAKMYYRDFLKRYDWNEPVARALAKTHEALGEMANARNIYQEIMQQCHSCHSRIDPYIKQKFADLSFASGLNTSEVLELYLSLVRENPQNASDYYQKVSLIYSAQGNDEEAQRFQLFAEKAKDRSA
ncbi:MAG: tetratricopeptide repeat protein [Deltaproteobacteria bacterium]|nr:tetratricopeptide repeat protein [Deltaproteobacteria bacterium]